MKEKLGQLVQYFKETKAETRKVVWPDRRYITTATIIILILVVLSGVYVMTVDFVLTKIFGLLLR
jgi:preprotein translocase subunit SecE